MRKPIDRRSTKTKVIEAVVLIALLCGACYFAKTKYDDWHSRQPYPVAQAALQQISEAVPEASLHIEELDYVTHQDGTRTYTLLNEEDRIAGGIDLAVCGEDSFGKPMYELKGIKGAMEVEVLGSDEASFTVDDRGYSHTWIEAEDRILAGRVSSAGVGGLFTDLQILPAEGYELVKVQEGRLVLTVPGREKDEDEIRAAVSEYLVTTWDSSKGHSVYELTMTNPLFLAEDEALVFAHCSHGKDEEDQKASDTCLYLKYNDRTHWTVRDEADEQTADLTYMKEAIYEIPEYPLPPKSASRKLPYYIMVNREMNTVTIYEIGEDGYYSEPFKAMICSTGREGHETPTGDFAIQSFKADWCYMIDGSYGQYATGFLEGGYLFHSVCYSAKDKATLLTEEYNALGGFASAGCVRLQVEDAKWIYDNCEEGTGVTVYDGPNAGPLGKPEKAVEEITPETDNGWDPTDPDPNNPW